MRDMADRRTHFSASSDRLSQLQELILVLRNLPESEFLDCLMSCKALAERYSQKAAKAENSKKVQGQAKEAARSRIAS